MRSRRQVLSVAIPVLAFLLPLDSVSAGESPYNPGAAPAAPQDYSYVCVAGNVGSFHTLYITDAHHADWPVSDGTVIRKASSAWTQAIRGQPYPYNAYCTLDRTTHIQQLRQSLLAQPHEKTVNIKWQYGQAGPAEVSGSSTATPSSPVQMGNGSIPSAPAAAAPPSAPASTPFAGAAQGFVDQSRAQVNGQINQAQQNLLNNLLGH